MHSYNDREAIMTIYTVKKPTVRAYRLAPPILMDPACGLPLILDRTEAEVFLQRTREAGYLATPGIDFFRYGKITCSDPDRQIHPGLLYYCLTGCGSDYVGIDRKHFMFLPENAPSYLVLDYRPSPDDLLWKPYKIELSMQSVTFSFMTPNPKCPSAILSAQISFEKLAFHFEFRIVYQKKNQREDYICRWSPIDDPYGSHAPFQIHYELTFNAGDVLAGLARRENVYNVFPGIRSSDPIESTRVYGRSVHTNIYDSDL